MECQSHLGWQWVYKQLQWIFCQENKPVVGNNAAYDSYWSGRLRNYGTLQTLLCSMITWSYLLSFWLKDTVTSYRKSKCLPSLMWDNRYYIATLAMQCSLLGFSWMEDMCVCISITSQKGEGRKKRLRPEVTIQSAFQIPKSGLKTKFIFGVIFPFLEMERLANAFPMLVIFAYKFMTLSCTQMQPLRCQSSTCLW